MITISLCMIVRNEEKGLARCLAGVRDIVDEIVIVDTGSEDRTKEIAAEFGAVIYDFEWINDFAAARNYSFSKATKDYILWLDADDVIMEADQEHFKELKKSLTPDVRAVSMNYVLRVNADGSPSSSMKRNRLVRRNCGFKWIGVVHEYLEVFGYPLHSDVLVYHQKDKAYTERNLQIYRDRKEKGEFFSARDIYYFGNELRDHGHLEEAIKTYREFLDMGEGWSENLYQACLKLANCYERLGDRAKKRMALWETLRFGIPQSEFCCQLGKDFMIDPNYNLAIYWFNQALVLPKRESMGMQDLTTTTWYPHLMICLCYDRMGDRVKANEHNEKALQFAPAHPSMLHNRSYFKRVLGDAYREYTAEDSEHKEG